MTSYFVQDIPSEDFVVVPTRAGNLVPLIPFTDVEVTLFDGDGVEVETPGFTTTITPEFEVVIEWPDTTPFETPGLYSLSLVLLGDTVRETADSIPLVVEGRDGWHTLASARSQIESGTTDKDEVLWTLLQAAKASVLAYAPALAEDAPIPADYRQAQLLQARNILNGATTDPGMSQDGQLFIVRPYALDNFVKQLLRPKRVLGVLQ